MEQQASIGLVVAALTAGVWGCGTGHREDPEQVGTHASELSAWARANFAQVLRVEAGRTRVVNRCELTVLVSEPTPLTFSGSEPLRGPTTLRSVGWTGSGVSVPGLSVTECVTYPCEVRAVYRVVLTSGNAVSCELTADDGISRLVGSSSGSALTVTEAPSASLVARQAIRLGAPGTPVSGMCVLRWIDELSTSQVTDFQVLVNGELRVGLPGPTQLGGLSWPSDGPAVDFGTLQVGLGGSTRLKYQALRREGLSEGDTLRCAGTYESQPGMPAFDLNVSLAPSGNGLSLTTDATRWTCDAASFGAGDGCNCGCGIIDPDCSAQECALYQSSFEPGEPQFEKVAGTGVFSTVPPAGTNARTGASVITNSTVTTAYTGRSIQSVDCVPLRTDSSPLMGTIYGEASTNNGGNTVLGRLKMLWFTDSACMTVHATTASAGTGVELPQGSYVEVPFGALPPAGATHFKVRFEVHDDNGAPNNEDDWAADDVTLSQ